MNPIVSHRAHGGNAPAISNVPAVANADSSPQASAHIDDGAAPVVGSGPSAPQGANALGQAVNLMASPQGQAALAAIEAAQLASPQAERIADLIDLLPTYPLLDGDADAPGDAHNLRSLFDPAIWAPELEAARAAWAQGRAKAPNNPLFEQQNMTALVFILMLAAQQETTEEKRDVLKQLRMYSGMLDALNKLVSRELLPAQRKLNTMAAQEKDVDRMGRFEVRVDFPQEIDTQHAVMDPKTGEVTLTMDMGDAPQRLETAQGIAALMSLADQWRSSIQNRQSQQSTRFQAQDNASAATLNIINGVLKISHEGASNSIRNLSG